MRKRRTKRTQGRRYSDCTPKMEACNTDEGCTDWKQTARRYSHSCDPSMEICTTDEDCTDWKQTARRYSSSCNPAMERCNTKEDCVDWKGRSFSSVGPVASGFDHYGYPIVRNFNLPAPYRMSEGRRYGADQAYIKPMRLVAALPGEPPRPKVGIAKVSKFKLKAFPTVPAAPDDLPSQYKFCVQKGVSGYFFRYRNPKASLHGAEAIVVGCEPAPNGLMMCQVNMPGTSNLISVPLCEDPSSDKEPLPRSCCVKILGDESGQVVCPGSAYDLLIVKIVTFAELDGIQFVSIEHPDLPGGGSRLPVCEPIEEEPDERPCCIEEETGQIVCAEGISFPLAGRRIPMEYLEFAEDASGMKVARLRCGDITNIPPHERAADPTLDAMFSVCEELGGYVFQVCTKKPPKRKPKISIPTPPPKFPDICCYNPETGKLVCEGTRYHDLPVEVVNEAIVAGEPIVSVAHSSIPGGQARVPLCPPEPDIPHLPPADCCVIESSAGLSLSCDPQSHPWNGKDVTGVGTCHDTPNGRICVIVIEDERGNPQTYEFPVCPPRTPPKEVPPSTSVDPAPEPVPVPVPERPKLPPPSRGPIDDGEREEASRCRQRWDEMVNKPTKITKCDRKWLEVLKKIRSGQAACCPGRRASSLNNNLAKAKPRKYGYGGIKDKHRKYGRFPGLRGGRRMI